jgi:hypothetical protein
LSVSKGGDAYEASLDGADILLLLEGGNPGTAKSVSVMRWLSVKQKITERRRRTTSAQALQGPPLVMRHIGAVPPSAPLACGLVTLCKLTGRLQVFFQARQHAFRKRPDFRIAALLGLVLEKVD